MSDDVTKLPKWAQFRIKVLESDVEAARKEADAFAGREQTAIAIDADAALMGRGKYPRFIGERSCIEYKLQFGEIEIALRDGALRVMASGIGKLVMEPVASNVITLRMVDDR